MVHLWLPNLKSPGPTVSNAWRVACSVFAFAGPGPEVINGRLAMLAFVAAAGAEFATGFTAVQQLREAPALVGVTFVVFIIASLVRPTSAVPCPSREIEVSIIAAHTHGFVIGVACGR